MKAILFASQAQNGKDEGANYLKNYLDINCSNVLFSREAFAFNVKKVFCDTFNVNLGFIEEWKTKQEIPEGFDMPVRQALQFIGDGFRKIKGSIWRDLVFNIKNSKIISDGRYINELARCKEEGGVNVLVARPGFVNDDPNGSEAQIRPYIIWAMENLQSGIVNKQEHYSGYPENFFDLVDIFLLNDGSLEDYYKKIKDIVVPCIVKKWTLKNDFEQQI